MNQQAQPVVKCIGLTKIFKDFWGRPKAKAVNDLDLEIYEGEIFGLLGPNGSGKSTTIKMLLGLLYPTHGVISIFGNPPTDVKTKRRIGYLPEESYLYKYLTAEETLDFFGALFNLSPTERKSRSSQLLEMVGLAHAAKRQVGEFSKGMQRRIGLAQAMINDPDLLILDEPTSGLDPIGCREIKDLILFLKKRGKTVIVSSHLLADVEDVCDRVVILYGGKIRTAGKLNSLLQLSEQQQIKIPYLPPEQTQKIISILKEELKNSEISIEHPKRSLEELFLEVVKTAQNEKIETFGAHSGGTIAQYLTENLPQKDKILDLLSLQEQPQPEQKIQEQIQTTKPDTILSQLAEENQAQPSQRTKQSDEPDLSDLDKVNEKLSKLLDNSDFNTDKK